MTARKKAATTPSLHWHMNNHPDGRQMFFPLDKRPFIIPAALPGSAHST